MLSTVAGQAMSDKRINAFQNAAILSGSGGITLVGLLLSPPAASGLG
jgi:hypothetical protein